MAVLNEKISNTKTITQITVETMTDDELKTKVEELEALIKTGNDYAQAETQARELLAEDALVNKPELHCRILLAFSESLWRRGMAQDALSFSEQALTITEQIESKELQAKALGNMGNIHKNLSDYSLALEYYGKALALDEELGNKAGFATSISNIGAIYIKLSDYSRALEYLQRSLALNEELGRKIGIAINLGTLGSVYQHLSDYPRALEYLQRALTLNDELGNKVGIAVNLSTLGNVYFLLSDYPRGLEYSKKSLALSEELGDKVGIATNLSNIGTGYINLSSYTLALEYYKKALAINYEIERKEGIAISLGNIGNVYEILSDYPTALEYYHKSLALNEELKRIYGVAQNLSNIGMLYGNVKFNVCDTIKAEEYLLKSIAVCKKIGAKQLEYEVHEYLAFLYEQQERWKDFAVHYKRYHELEKEVQSEEATKQAQLMEHRRKIEEAERDRQIKLARFQEQEKILHKTLPPVIADRLIAGEKDIADRYDAVSILFADIVGFTPLSARLSPREVVHILNDLFSRFDQLTKKYGVERIKTIGDAYMIVAGAPEVVEDHAERLAKTAFAMLDEIVDFNSKSGHTINLRIGLNSGEAVAAVVGNVKFTYDFWSDAVNTAARMESHGEAGKIHVTEEFVRELGMRNKELSGDNSQLVIPHSQFIFVPRGEMEIKGKGTMRTYFLEKVSV